MNIDESVFRMPIYSVQTNYIVMNIDELWNTWNGVEHGVMNIDESVFRMPIYSVQTNYIVMNIDESCGTRSYEY